MFTFFLDVCILILWTLVVLWGKQWHFNPIALRKAKTVCNFGLSECNRVKIKLEHLTKGFICSPPVPLPNEIKICRCLEGWQKDKLQSFQSVSSPGPLSSPSLIVLSQNVRNYRDKYNKLTIQISCKGYRNFSQWPKLEQVSQPHPPPQLPLPTPIYYQ